VTLELGPGLADEVRAALEAEDAASAREHLEHDIVGWLTTVTPSGRPQTAVVPFLWDGEGILFYSRPATPKVRNIAARPEVSFHLNCDPYGDQVVVIEGLARIDPSAPRSDEHPGYKAKYHEPLAHWEMDEAKTASDFNVPIRIRPERVHTW
jgi:PPOX class probable F420-dependent enzyme